MDARRFEGKVALVTGGNSGIGLAVAKGLVDEGARVVIVGRNAETVARSAGELGASAHGVVADTARLDELDRVIAATREFGGGRLDVVFANAGVGTFGPLAATTEAMWDTMFDINVKGVYFTVQKAVPLMKPGGAIVLNASVAAGKGNVGSSVYAATKAAVRSFGRTLADELVERGIRVNVVSPGPIETPIFDRTMNAEQVAGDQGGDARAQPDEALRHDRRGGRGRALPRLRRGVVHHRRRPARRRRGRQLLARRGRHRCPSRGQRAGRRDADGRPTTRAASPRRSPRAAIRPPPRRR